MRKLKTGDEVIVIAGKDKGKRGKITKVIAADTRKGDRFLVSGVNRIKKHVKPNPQAQVQGGIVEKEAPIAASNVAIFNSETSKGDRVGFRILEDGRKVRFFKSNGQQIDD
ncbi:50S ribosomal protein L24 [Natronospirillum operosum]|uniref:Large ribosomal subunit protein uL24 n=1 Tax=Natronospirillum operosum TaxID=2759953 RepID=A0A4Z0W606_9GAMM|nr:50S ribosomal protein L24 [Natronospirillum operosum]TGG90179.1 50S ribosomal protein L24 [Natronospirillum operosum]